MTSVGARPLAVEDSKRCFTLVSTRAKSFLEQVRDGAIQAIKRDALYVQLAEVVFAYWAAKLHHPRAILDKGREKRITARLRESRGDWGLLCYAVDGALKDDFLMGRADRSSRRYDGIETIFRDRAQVERLAEMCPRFQAGEQHPLVVKYSANANT
jgi:hypothetical protein